MSSVNSNDCLVGCELSHDRIRIAVIDPARPGTGDTKFRRLRCDEIVIPDVEAYSPASLPPTSTLVPLFKAALARLGVRGGRAAVAVGGPRMVLRYFVGSDSTVRTALRHATERSVNYLRLGPGDRVVGEHIHPLGDGRIHGLLAVSASNAIDPLAGTLKQVGLKVKVIEPALVALTRIGSMTGNFSDSKTAFVLSVDSDGIDIGLVCDGHILFSHRPPSTAGPGSEAQELESVGSDRSSNICKELERVSRHYLRAFGMSDEVHQVNICGPADLAQPYVSALQQSQELQTNVLTLNETVSNALSVPYDDLTGSETHAVALGAVAGLLIDGSDVIGPNLTSEPKIQRRPPWEALFRAALWPTLIALGIWGIAYLVQDRLDNRVAKLHVELDYPSPAEAKCRELQMQLVQAEQRTLRLSDLSQRFRDRDWRGLAETVRICVPDRLWLTRVHLTGNQQLSIKGTAYDEALIYQFTKNLEGSPLFERVTIITQTSSRQKNTFVTEFSVECALTSNLHEPRVSGT